MANTAPSYDDYERPRGSKLLLIFLGVFLIGLAAWFILRPNGLLQQVTEERVEEALLANGVPMPMAGCMAPRLTDRLSIEQLRRLERLAPDDGEARFPRTAEQALARLRRVGDDEAVEQLVRVATICGVELIIGG